jgi:drug/metabolite transporter (DMT)-like permease
VALDAFALALAAAFVHAGWNLLTARSASSVAASAIALAAGAVAFAPVAIATWDVRAGVVPYAIASVGLEVAYFTLLATAYDRAPLTVVYPAARGLSVVLVLVVSVAVLGASPPPAAVAGVLAVAAGVVLVRGARGRGVGLAVAVAACIAGYTLVDHAALDHAAPLPYLELVLAPTALLALALAGVLVGPGALAGAVRSDAVVAGLGMFAAYGLTLAALARADAAPVAAVRESSVVLAAELAALTASERVPPARWAGALAVAAGVAAIALA